MEGQTSILNATVLQREKFIRLISREMRLEHVDITHWAGLGGVRYIPSDFVDKLEKGEESVDAEQVRRNLLENVKAENADVIDHRNIQLVHKLRSSDSAFSLGEGRKRLLENFYRWFILLIDVAQRTVAFAFDSGW